MKKVIYIILGVVSIVLGVIGVFVPGLPTTPFLLLSSWLFYKSSKRLHDTLHRSWLGGYIRRYESGEGVSLLSKWISIGCMWGMISISSFCFIEHAHIRMLLFVLGGIGTCSILLMVSTAKKKRDDEVQKRNE